MRRARTSLAALAVFGACSSVEPCEEPEGLMRPNPLVLGSFQDPRNVDASRAVDVVFLSDGFQEDQLEVFRERVGALIDGVREDVLISRRPSLFNFHRVDVASQTADVTNADRADTAFGGCLKRDALGLSEDWFLDAFISFESASVLRPHLPDVDVFVTIVNTELGRARGALEVATDPDPIVWLNNGIVMNVANDARTLTHELGHSLFGLGDEYSDSSAPYPAPPAGSFSSLEALAAIPNLSLDGSGQKWARLVEGAKVGGRRYDDVDLRARRSGKYLATRRCSRRSVGSSRSRSR